MREALRLIPALLVGLGGILFTAGVTTVVAAETLTLGGAISGGIGILLVVLGFALRYSGLRRVVPWLKSPHARLLVLHGEYKNLLADLQAEAAAPNDLDRPRYEERVQGLDSRFRTVMVQDWEFDWAATKRTEEYRLATFRDVWSHDKWISHATKHTLERLRIVERLMRSPGV